MCGGGIEGGGRMNKEEEGMEEEEEAMEEKEEGKRGG